MKKFITVILAVFFMSITSFSQCPPAISFNTPGVFHIPTVANPKKMIDFPTPQGVYKKIHLNLDVKLGQWYTPDPSASHFVFWLVTDAKNLNMLGYVTLFGPGTDRLMLRHGWKVQHGDKAKLMEKTAFGSLKKFEPGKTYNFDYIYDAENSYVNLVVTDKATNQQFLSVEHYPFSNSFNYGPNENTTVHFGFVEGVNPNEVPTYGWEYSNLKVDLYNKSAPVISASDVIYATCAGCPDGNASIQVNGGTKPYLYAWSNGATTSAINSIAPGGYTVTVTDANGCKDKSIVDVGLLPNANAVEPIKISEDDAHWLEYNGQLTYLAGFTHGLGNINDQQNQYYKKYIDWLSNNNLNTFRNFPFSGQEIGDLAVGDYMKGPYQRTGPGTANDGQPKFNLNQYDPAFFTHWKNVLNYAQSKNVIMQMTIYATGHWREWYKTGCNGQTTGSTTTWCHTYDAFYGGNNVNGVNVASIDQICDPAHPVNTWQKKLIEKYVDEFGANPNLIWEICNENFENVKWEDELAGYLRSYELSQGIKPHLILGKDIPNHQMTPGGRETLTVEELHRDLAGVRGNSIPYLYHNDGPNQVNAAQRRYLSWGAFTAGVNADIFYVKNWSVPDSVDMASQDLQDGLKYTGFLRKFLNDYQVDLRGMVSDTTLASNYYLNVWCMGRSGEEYVIYLMNGGSTNVSGLPALHDAFWFNPRTGVSQNATATNGNKFTTPDNNDWVLYIRKPKKTDVEVVYITAPLHSECKDTTDIFAQIQNNGTRDLYEVRLNYKLDNGPAASQMFTLSPWVKVGDKKWLSIPKALKNLTQGAHVLKVWTSNPNDATDSAPANDTLTLNFNNGTQGQPLPFTEDFENGVPGDWTIYNPDGGQTWWNLGIGYNSAKSVAIDNWAYQGAYFKADYLVLPGLDLSSVQNPALTFRLSHISKPVAYRYDSLEVLVSTDCAKTFISVWGKGTQALNTAAASANAFIPAGPGDWTLETVNLSAFKTSNDAIILFRNWSNNGNTTLVDKINIMNVPATSVNEVEGFNSVSIFPNPSSEAVELTYQLQNTDEVKITLVNSIGQVVSTINQGMQPAGARSAKINISAHPAGMYKIMIVIQNRTPSVATLIILK